MNTAPLNKAGFLGLEDVTWLYTGAESPVHRSVRAAVDEYMDRRVEGPGGRAFNAGIEASCRGKFGELLGVESTDIALLSNASEAIAAVLLSLRLQAGDNIVLHTLEYPSAMLAGLALGEQGIEVRIVPHDQWKIGPEALLAQVDLKTRIVLTSHVSYLSGARLDYQRLYGALQFTPTLLLLDATQSMGVVPVNALAADFTVSSTYKWLLGMHGGGILAVNPARTSHLTPVSAGWRSVPNLFSADRFEKVGRYPDARRYELGFPAFATIAALNASLDVLLQAGMENIEQHVTQVGTRLIAGLEALGWEIMTPPAPHERGGSVSFVCERGEELVNELAASRIYAWGGDGRVRFSAHGFNDTGDIERVLTALSHLTPRYR